MKNAEDLIGSPVESGCIVAPPGHVKGAAITGAASGLFGAAGRAASDRLFSTTPATSPFAGTAYKLGYLALTATEVALLAAKAAMVGQKAVEVLARAPRTSLDSLDLGEGKLARPLAVRFSDGTSWLIEVPSLRAKDAEKFVSGI